MSKGSNSIKDEEGYQLALNDLEERSRELIEGVFLDVRGYASKASLAFRDPQRWVKIAGMLVNGRTPRQIETDGVAAFYVCKNVEAQLMESPLYGDVRREMAVRVMQALNTTVGIAELNGEALARRHAKMEEEDYDEEDLSNLHKNQKESALAIKEMSKVFQQLRGDAPPPQELVVRHTYEQMLEEVNKAREKEGGGIKKAEKVMDLGSDVEVIEM